MALGTSAGDILPELNMSLSADFRSAYISSSGSAVETRPVTSQCLAGTYGFGEYGTLAGYVWTVSALTGQKDRFRRRAFNEVESGLLYRYSWEFADGLSLNNSAGHLWDPEFGYHGFKESEITHEIAVVQSLENPYVTPYYDLQGAYHPTRWVRVNTGIRHAFTLLDGALSLTPFGHVIWGSGRRYEQKFEAAPNSDICGFTPMYLMTGVLANYRVHERLTLYLRLQQYDVIDPSGRRHEKARDVSWAVRDMPFVVAGVTVHF